MDSGHDLIVAVQVYMSGCSSTDTYPNSKVAQTLILTGSPLIR